jgi:hypothetical protein
MKKKKKKKMTTMGWPANPILAKGATPMVGLGVAESPARVKDKKIKIKNK